MYKLKNKSNNKNKKGRGLIKNNLTKIILLILSFTLCVGIFVFCIVSVPRNVTLVASETSGIQQKDDTDDENDTDTTICYTNVKDIPESNGYIIKQSEDCIFVYVEDLPVYAVRAEIESFPKEDITALNKGIYAENKKQLVNIVEYMES